MDFDNSLEIITPTKSTSLTISGTGALFIPAGTVGQRPVAPQSGYIRFNTTDTVLEYYNGVAVQWQTFGSATLNSLLSVSGTGMLVQTSPGVYAARSIAGTTNRVTLTNGDGVAGNPTVDISSAYVGQATITTLGTVGTGTWNATTIAATVGGTGQTVYAVGDLLAANTTTTLSRVADVATGNALISGGVSTLPLWGKIGLTTHVSGTLPIASGGTNLTALGTANQILGVNTGATALEYKTVTAGAGITITPAAGTITIAATNTGTVTSVSGSGGTTGLTLTGGPIITTGTLTLGGTLAVANGGTALTTTPTNGQLLIGNGTNYTLSTITAGTAIGITNAAGSITLNNTGVTSNVAGTGISVSGATGAVTIGNTGVLSFSAGTTGFAPSSPTTGAITLSGTLIPANGGTGATATPTNGQLLIGNVSGAYTPANITAGTAIGVVNASGSITLNNTGVTSNVAGTGISVSGATGAVTITNTGVTSAVAGTGISVSGATGAVTFTNTGATSITGTANQITASAATGAITLSTPVAFIAPGSVQVTTTLLQTQSAALTAAGATQGTATSAPSRYNIVTTVAAGTGVILPLPVTPFGNEIYVANRGANPLNVYPNTGAAIVNGAVNTPVVIPVGQEATFVCTSTTQWWTTESVLTAGANITLTPSGGVLTIASTGGATTPAAPTNSVQWNNAGAFGGSASFLFTPGANPFATIQGTTATNQIRIGPAFTAPGLAAQYAAGGTSTVYIETNGTDQDGQLVYFNNGGSAAVSGYIGYAYDTAAPYIRVVDADDDAPYITFNTIGTGTISNPLYVSAFGARGTNASRTLGNNSGFSWYVGANTSASALITANAPVMELDTQFLRIPTGTTAQRPATPILGMIRYNTTTSRVEMYDQTTTTPQWASLMGVIDKSTTAVTATVAAATTIMTYSVPGGTLLTDGVLRFSLEGDWVNPNAGGGGARTCTFLVSYGGTTLWSATSPSLASAARTGWEMQLSLVAANSVTAQSLTGTLTMSTIGTPTTGTTGVIGATAFGNASIYGTSAVNSAVAQTLLVTVAFSGVTPGFTRRFYTIEKL